MLRTVVDCAFEVGLPWECDNFGFASVAGGEDDVVGVEGTGAAITSLNVDSPLLFLVGVDCLADGAGSPDVQLHEGSV